MRLKHGFKQYKEALKEANLGETLFYTEQDGWYFKNVQYGYRCYDGEFEVQHYYINANTNIRTVRGTKKSYNDMRQCLLETIWSTEEYLRMKNG